MAAPQLVSQTTSSNASSTSHTMAQPTGVVNGNLMLCISSIDASSGSFATTSTTSSGWTRLDTATVSSGSLSTSYALFAKIASASNVLILTHSAARVSTSAMLQIGGWDGTIANVAFGRGTFTSSGAPNPPSVTGIKGASVPWDYLAVAALAAGSSSTAISTYPANYQNGQRGIVGSGTSGQMVASAVRQVTDVTAEDPGAYALASNDSGLAITIVIPGATGPAATTPTRGRGSFHHLVGAP